MSSSISLSTVSQAKMALHAARHGHGNPIHGILVGRSSPASVEVTDAVPVCHEEPTKPIVDMSLRLVDGHLTIKNDGTRIVGWYTANANAGDDAPGPSARRVASCLSAEEGCGGCVLLAVSSGRIAGCLAGDGDGGPICDASRRTASPGRTRDSWTGRGYRRRTGGRGSARSSGRRFGRPAGRGRATSPPVGAGLSCQYATSSIIWTTAAGGIGSRIEKSVHL